MRDRLERRLEIVGRHLEREKPPVEIGHREGLLEHVLRGIAGDGVAHQAAHILLRLGRHRRSIAAASPPPVTLRSAEESQPECRDRAGALRQNRREPSILAGSDRTFQRRRVAGSRWYRESMPPFRQRPLTWLFFIATACLDVVALATHRRSARGSTRSLVGQIIVVGGVARRGAQCIGSRARAALSSASLALTRSPTIASKADACWIRRSTGPYVLGALACIAVGDDCGSSRLACSLARAVFGPASRQSEGALAVSRRRNLRLDDRRRRCGSWRCSMRAFRALS